MRVLTLLLGHELDKQLDKVLSLARKYDKNENAFRFRYGVATANGFSLADPAIEHLSLYISLSISQSIRLLRIYLYISVTVTVSLDTCTTAVPDRRRRARSNDTAELHAPKCCYRVSW